MQLLGLVGNVRDTRLSLTLPYPLIPVHKFSTIAAFAVLAPPRSSFFSGTDLTDWRGPLAPENPWKPRPDGPRRLPLRSILRNEHPVVSTLSQRLVLRVRAGRLCDQNAAPKSAYIPRHGRCR